MPRPLYRGLSGSCRITNLATHGVFDDDLKPKEFSGNGFGHDILNPMAPYRTKQSLSLSLLKFGLAIIILAALSGSLYWSISISKASKVSIHRSYRRLQEQLIADLADIGEISLGTSKLKDLDFCLSEYENYVPCYYNVSENLDSVEQSDVSIEYDRLCARGKEKEPACLVLPPKNYKIPLRWPTGRDFIWKENVKISGNEFSSGSLTKRMMVEEEQISFRSDSLMVDGVEDYSHQIAEMVGLRNESNFNEAGVRTVLDIGCGFGSLGAHLFSKQLLTMCIANYEPSGSQVQLTLERGLPAMVGSFASKQLPFPHLSFDMLHCARCGIDWEKNDGIFLVEVDRLLRPGGYFVYTSITNTHRSLRIKENQKKWTKIRDFAENLCWDLMSQQDDTTIWKKTSKKKCYSSRKSGPPICGKSRDTESPYYQALNPCIGGTRSPRWIPIEERTPWPSRSNLNSTELAIHGLHAEDIAEDALNWNSATRNYWSLLSPLIFSDHPKRPGDEDPSPPFNMLRNVLDMNARFGGFNAALLDAGKSVWVMNVVPTSGPNYLPLILDRGFIGVQHDWCDAFPTYPRTYDMVHAEGLLSLMSNHQHRCSTLDIFVEMDRILRPEFKNGFKPNDGSSKEHPTEGCISAVHAQSTYIHTNLSSLAKRTNSVRVSPYTDTGWVILRDSAPLIEALRPLTARLKWDTRLMNLDGNSDEKLLVCQKPFFRKQL